MVGLSTSVGVRHGRSRWISGALPTIAAIRYPGGCSNHSVTRAARTHGGCDHLTLDRIDLSWDASIGGDIQRSIPAISDDNLFIDSLDPTLHALSRNDGREVWSADRDGSLSDSSPVYDDGRVYVGSGGGSLHAFDATTGEEYWRYSGDSAIVSTPAVAEDRVYVARNDGLVLALRDGAVEWQSQLPAPVYNRLSFDPAREHLYVTTSGGTLHALDASAGARGLAPDL